MIIVTVQFLVLELRALIIGTTYATNSGLLSVWPDWAIYWTFGKFLKPLATINLPKSPKLLGNFCKGVKIIFLVKSYLGNFIDVWRFFYGHNAHGSSPPANIMKASNVQCFNCNCIGEFCPPYDVTSSPAWATTLELHLARAQTVTQRITIPRKTILWGLKLCEQNQF